VNKDLSIVEVKADPEASAWLTRRQALRALEEHHTLLALKEHRNLLLAQHAKTTMALTFHRLPILVGRFSPLASLSF
jgi:hypothetical protein